MGIENSYPLIKETKKYISLFVPKLMLRAASKHTRNIKDEEVLLNYDNLFSLNKSSQQDIIENNTNITYGFDYKINDPHFDLTANGRERNILRVAYCKYSLFKRNVFGKKIYK